MNQRTPYFIPSHRSPWAVITRRRFQPWRFYDTYGTRIVARLAAALQRRIWGVETRVVRAWIPINEQR